MVNALEALIISLQGHHGRLRFIHKFRVLIILEVHRHYPRDQIGHLCHPNCIQGRVTPSLALRLHHFAETGDDSIARNNVENATQIGSTIGQKPSDKAHGIHFNHGQGSASRCIKRQLQPLRAANGRGHLAPRLGSRTVVNVLSHQIPSLNISPSDKRL